MLISNKISVFPNPCLGLANLHFEFEQALEINTEIYNSSGQKVFSKNFGCIPANRNEITPDVTQLNSGLYFVNFNTLCNSYTQSLVVQYRESI